MDNTPYIFEFISEPPILKFDKTIPLRVYPRILFRDSLFEFFPYAEVHYKDSSGQISDKVFFVEGLDFDLSFGRDEYKEDKKTKGGYLSHRYVWSENQINMVTVSEKISGNNVFVLISHYKKYNYPRSRAFNYEDSRDNKKISDIIKEVIEKDWNVPKNKQFISKSYNGFPYVNQNSWTNRFFIERCAEIAYSSSYSKSPTYTFINCNGEFYFNTLEEMLNAPPVKKFKITLAEDMQTNSDIIKTYNVQQGGMPVNFPNYSRAFYRFLPDATLKKEEKKIHEATPKFNEKEKILIRNGYIPKEDNTSHSYFGMQDLDNGLEIYKGYQNNQYRDTALCYRLLLVTQHEPNLLTGKNIEIEVLDLDNEKAQEYAGKWLICESTHTVNDQGVPYSQLTISKPKIRLDSDHPIKDFH